ncbi:MAG: hypothetical protein AB1499_14655 [Nitrospirota bacterium]
MVLFVLGLVIGSVGGMIMMAMFLTGKTRESSFNERMNMLRPTNTSSSGTGDSNGENY